MKNPFGELYQEWVNSDYNPERYPDAPNTIDIELTNHCNLKCSMCPVGKGTMKRRKGYMNSFVFSQILDSCKDFKPAIRFIRWGEPLLHKNWGFFVSEVKQRGLLCHMTTNGHLLNNGLVHEIFMTGLDSLKVSFQGYDWMEYEDYRGVDYMDILYQQLDVLTKKKKGGKPYVVVGTTVEKLDCRRTELFKQRFSDVADLVLVSQTYDLDQKRESIPKCWEVYNKLSVDWDGTISACCGDYDNFMKLGDIKKNQLLDVWHGDKLKKIRTKLQNGDLKGLPLCQKCARASYEV